MPNLYLNQSLIKGLTLLRYIAGNNGRATMTELANALNMDKATTRRFLATLQELGYIRPDLERKVWSLTLDVLELGYSALSGLEWRDVAKVELEKLFASMEHIPGISVSLCTLQGADVLYLVRMETQGFLPMDLAVGVRRPAFASSMGKMILAMLPDKERAAVLDQIQIRTLTNHTVRSRAELEEQLSLFRELGYAVSDREVSALSRSLAVPIMRHGHVLAAVAVATQAERMSMSELESLALEPLHNCVSTMNTVLDQVEHKQ